MPLNRIKARKRGRKRARSRARISKGLLLLLIVIIWAPVGAASQLPPPKTGEPLPVIHLPRPADPEHMHYLGIPTMLTDSFGLHQIPADLVVVEIFSMYCPHCQREAPKVNALFAALQKRPETDPKIRLLGIGVGNSPMEVEVFRKTYQVAFPLFPDGDFTIHKQLGEVRTPFFFAFRPSGTAPSTLDLTHLGPLDSVDAFIHRLNKLVQE